MVNETSDKRTSETQMLTFCLVAIFKVESKELELKLETQTQAVPQAHGHTDLQTHQHTDAQIQDAQTHRRTDAQMHRRTDAQTHRHIDLPPDAQKQTDTETHRQSHYAYLSSALAPAVIGRVN